MSHGGCKVVAGGGAIAHGGRGDASCFRVLAHGSGVIPHGECAETGGEGGDADRLGCVAQGSGGITDGISPRADGSGPIADRDSIGPDCRRERAAGQGVDACGGGVEAAGSGADAHGGGGVAAGDRAGAHGGGIRATRDGCVPQFHVGGVDCDIVRTLDNHVADNVKRCLGKCGADAHKIIHHEINRGGHRLEQCETGGPGARNG